MGVSLKLELVHLFSAGSVPSSRGACLSRWRPGKLLQSAAKAKSAMPSTRNSIRAAQNMRTTALAVGDTVTMASASTPGYSLSGCVTQVKEATQVSGRKTCVLSLR